MYVYNIDRPTGARLHAHACATRRDATMRRRLAPYDATRQDTMRYRQRTLRTWYGLQLSTETPREQTGETVFHEYLQEACFVPTEVSENLWKPPG